MNKQLALALVLATAPLAATAGELSYSHVEAGYAHLDLEGEEADGFQLRGSVAVAEHVYLFGGYGKVEGKDYDVELEESQAGVGLRSPTGERADFIFELGQVRHAVEVDGALGSASETINGGRLSVGLRGLLADRLEGWIKTSYNDGGDFDGSFSAVLGAHFSFNPTWGLIAEVESGELVEDADTVKGLLGVRASF